MSTNQNIIEFINTNFSTTYGDIQSEINTIFNNLTSDECYIQYNTNNLFIINGVSNNVQGSLTFSYLIPNLFRKCFTQNSVTVPNICPTFIFNSRVSKYFPLLLEEETIKSFLYFNFSSDINSLNDTKQLEKLISASKRLKLMKTNVTYGSYTPAYKIFNNLYSSDGLLVQLLNLNYYLNYASIVHSNEKIINSYTVQWNYTSYCICYTGYIDDTYIIGDDNNIINGSFANDLNNIRYSNINTSINASGINTNNIITLSPKNSIFTVIKYALDVYQDILLEIQYYMQNVYYCKKNYMNESNIPYLLELYKNYYNNQIYVNSRSIKITTINNIVPNIIEINVYLNNFIVLYLKQNSGVTLLNKQVISETEGFAFFSNTTYWYVSTNNPSAININDTWINNYGFTTTINFINDPVNGFLQSYYPTSGASSYTNTLFTTGGVNLTDNSAYSYIFYNSNGIVISKYYLMLTYVNPATAQSQGVSLNYYTLQT